jgi:hypothetical protein
VERIDIKLDSQNEPGYALKNVLIETWIAWIPCDDPKNGNEPPEHFGIPFAQPLLCGDDYPCDTWPKSGLVRII